MKPWLLSLPALERFLLDLTQIPILSLLILLSPLGMSRAGCFAILTKYFNPIVGELFYC